MSNDRVAKARVKRLAAKYRLSEYEIFGRAMRFLSDYESEHGKLPRDVGRSDEADGVEPPEPRPNRWPGI